MNLLIGTLFIKTRFCCLLEARRIAGWMDRTEVDGVRCEKDGVIWEGKWKRK